MGERLADAPAPLYIRSDEAFERVKRLGDDLRHLRERWNNRLILENGSVWESYFDGRAEIIVYGDWGVGPDDDIWAVRILAHDTILESIGAKSGVDVFDIYDRDRRHEIVVFVEIAQADAGPKVAVRIPARLYRFEDKFCGIGEGLLYRQIMAGGFKVFPFFRKRKMNLSGFSDGSQSRISPIVEGLPKVVDGISDDSAKMICDWLFGPIGQVKTIRLGEYSDGSCGLARNFVQIFGEGGRIADNRINVAIGPFDL